MTRNVAKRAVFARFRAALLREQPSEVPCFRLFPALSPLAFESRPPANYATARVVLIVDDAENADEAQLRRRLWLVSQSPTLGGRAKITLAARSTSALALRALRFRADDQSGDARYGVLAQRSP